MRILAISDIHGCFNTFKRLLEQLSFKKTDKLYLLGDYIDRGRYSKEVLDYIMNLQNQGYAIHCLRGNHEQMMLNALTTPEKERAWRMNGGTITLTSFGAFMPKDIPVRYYQFVEALPYFYETEDYIFVHAGLNLDRDGLFDDKHAMLWIRRWEKQADLAKLEGRIVVHGHSPQKYIEIAERLQHLGHIPVLNIDNGCAYTYNGGGQLCAVDLTNRKLYFEANVD